MTHQTDRLEAAVYNALRDFQQTADWPQLRLAQMRHHLAEHIARDLTLTPGALPATPDGISARDLAHALDNSTPYPVELTSTVAGFMAERLLEMLTISKRDEHPVWQPEEQPEPGPHPQPEDPATLTEADPAAVSAAVAPPTNQTAILADVERAIRTATGSCGYKAEDGCDFCNGVDAALDQVRRMADETATETPAPDSTTLLELVRDFLDPDPCSFDHHGYCQAHAAGFGGEPMSCPHGRARKLLADLEQPAAGARQDGAET
ncbi:hypothetical protein G6W51_17080 [Streptomyces coelicolor]|nr:hypothetical protein [Streptomyces coelicolor]